MAPASDSQLSGPWMSSQDLRALRAELGALRIRVEAQEEKIAEQEDRIERLEAERDRSVTLSEIGARSSEPAYSFVSSAPAASDRLPETVDKEDVEGRLRLARSCGAFLKRALGGDFRGGSGRDRLRLASRLYVILADHYGNLLTPPKVTKTWSECQTLCKVGGSCGQAVFLGFASQWEAGLPGPRQRRNGR